MRDRPSQTAEAVCFMRATELRRPATERILHDPYAPWFLSPPWRLALAGVRASGPVGRWAERTLTPGLTTLVLVRHRFIDDALRAALQTSADQLVLLGAGYDSRAWRLSEAVGDARVFEVDHPATSRRKAHIVSRRAAEIPAVDVTRVPVDFETQALSDRLLASGFQPDVRTLWVWEGVAMYLQRAAVLATLGDIRALSGPGSQVSMDFYTVDDRPTWAGTVWRAAPAALHVLGEPVTFALHPDDAPPLLERSGWEALDVAPPDELGRRYVRDGRAVFPGLYTVTARVASAPR